MTRETLAARCEVLSWDLSHGTLSKIEAQLRCVTDREVQLLAEASQVPVQKLYSVG
jgi:hypothetical protein